MGPSLSDHFPILTTLVLPFLFNDHDGNENLKTKILISDWRSEKIIECKAKLIIKYNDIFHNNFVNLATEEQNNLIISTITNLAQRLDIKKTIFLNENKITHKKYDQ